MMTVRIVLVFIIASILMAMVVWGATSIGWTHEHDRPDLDTWFSRLYNKKGGSCCNGEDNRPLEAVWSTEGADGKQHYRVKIEGKWVDVPDDALVDQPNKYGPALVWYYRSGDTFLIRCFMPGTLSVIKSNPVG